MISYLKGEIKSLPWSDGPIGDDTEVLKPALIEMNTNGIFTLNSQPALSAVKSNHEVFGWGPKNGFVYQKQYLEFFIHKDLVHTLLNRVEAHNAKDAHSVITYYAVDKLGRLLTNAHDDDINAVTWGVFPGEEILQPTIVEKISFLAWKDEVYRLLDEWVKIFHTKTITELVEEDKINAFSKLLTSFGDNFVLCNFVNNDFTSGNNIIFDLFDGLQVSSL